jgi:hypothetical protein
MHPQQEEKKEGGRRSRSLLTGLFALAVALFTASAVYAGLQAQATGTEVVQGGVLSLVLNPDAPSTGFSGSFPLMAPGDMHNVVVNLVNNGDLDNSGVVSLAVNGSTDPQSALLNSATEGLTVSVQQCSQSWVYPSPTTLPTCGGSVTSIISNQLVSTMGGGVGLPNSALLAGGAINHLLISVGEVGNETTLNGVVPSPGIQGHTAQLTFTFTEQQRAGVITDQ